MDQNDIDELYDKEFMDKRYGPNVKTRDYIDVMVKSIIRDLAVTTVLDLGCGACNFANTFKMYGCKEVVAVDGSSFAKDAVRSDIVFIQHDLRTLMYSDVSFELVFCVEVMEHIDAEYEEMALDNIVKCASKWIVFTGAPPGQGGVGHVNLREKSYWVNRFAERGFDVVPSEALESEWRKKKVRCWYVDNVLVLRKKQ